VGVAVQVAGDNVIFGVSENACMKRLALRFVHHQP
jgi:hypothetical protein